MKTSYSARRLSPNSKWMTDIDKQIQKEQQDLKRLKTVKASKAEKVEEKPRLHENILR